MSGFPLSRAGRLMHSNLREAIASAEEALAALAEGNASRAAYCASKCAIYGERAEAHTTVYLHEADGKV